MTGPCTCTHMQWLEQHVTDCPWWDWQATQSLLDGGPTPTVVNEDDA